MCALGHPLLASYSLAKCSNWIVCVPLYWCYAVWFTKYICEFDSILQYQYRGESYFIFGIFPAFYCYWLNCRKAHIGKDYCRVGTKTLSVGLARSLNYLRHSKDQVDSLIHSLKHSNLSITLWLYCESVEIQGTGGILNGVVLTRVKIFKANSCKRIVIFGVYSSLIP